MPQQTVHAPLDRTTQNPVGPGSSTGVSIDHGRTCRASAGTPARAPRWRGVRARPWSPRGRVGPHVRSAGVDAGMATAEYAIATLAAVGFAGLLVVILKGNEVKSMLMALVRQALTS